MTTTKETIYDEQINPLMAQILAICKEHNIEMVASFALDDGDGDGDEDEGLMCSSYVLLGENKEAMNPTLLGAARVIAHGWTAIPGSFAMTVTSGGASSKR